jgi:hypothetical protein
MMKSGSRAKISLRLFTALVGTDIANWPRGAAEANEAAFKREEAMRKREVM